MNHSLKYIIENHLSEAHWMSLIKREIQEKVIYTMNEATEQDKERMILRIKRLATASGLSAARGLYDKSRKYDRRAGDALHKLGRTYYSDEKGNLTPEQLKGAEGEYRKKEDTIRYAQNSSYGRYHRARPGQNLDIKA